MIRKQLQHLLSAVTLSLVCITQGVQADIQNAVWESPVAGSASGIQTFRGHVSSTTGAQVTVRLLIPSVSASFSLQIPWGAERTDVATTGPERFSGFGSALNVGDLPPGGPVEMILEMREGGGTGACAMPTCARITRSFTVAKPGARTGERAQFSFANDFAMFADLANNPVIDPIPVAARPSNVATDLATVLTDGGPEIIVAPVTIQDLTAGGGGTRTATARLRWVRNTQSFEIISSVASDTSFSAVQGILSNRCGLSGCHVGGGAALPSAMELNNQTNSFFSTVARQSLQSPQKLRVTPGNLDNSYLYQKIIPGGAIAAGTDRMPDGCSGATCLSTADINIIRDWILAGAPPPIP